MRTLGRADRAQRGPLRVRLMNTICTVHLRNTGNTADDRWGPWSKVGLVETTMCHSVPSSAISLSSPSEWSPWIIRQDWCNVHPVLIRLVLFSKSAVCQFGSIFVLFKTNIYVNATMYCIQLKLPSAPVSDCTVFLFVFFSNEILFSKSGSWHRHRKILFFLQNIIFCFARGIIDFFKNITSPTKKKYFIFYVHIFPFLPHTKNMLFFPTSYIGIGFFFFCENFFFFFFATSYIGIGKYFVFIFVFVFTDRDIIIDFNLVAIKKKKPVVTGPAPAPAA